MAYALQEFFKPWLNSTAEAKERFLRDPRAAISEIVGVPDDIEIAIEQTQGMAWFRASIPRQPSMAEGSLGEMQRRNERLQRCPVLGVSGSVFIRNHVAILAEHGLRIPDDVVVEIDQQSDGFIHFRVPLDQLS